MWVDWEDIPAASEWAQDIDDNIDAAESVVFVVSTHSLASEYCTAEFRHAQERGKRIVPIACDAADPEVAQPGLRQLNWIWCREGDDRDAAFAKLAGALDTDLEWARAHTRLLVRAVDWEARGDSSLLLRGRDLKQAEEELAANAGKEPTPTELQQRYVHASRRGASRRQRILLGGVLLALVVSIGLGVAALLQRNTANQRARIARSQALAAQAVGVLSTAPATALADAVKAVETSRTDEARVALRRAILANPVEYVIPAGPDDRRLAASAGSRVDTKATLAFSADGKLLVGLTPAGSLHVWRGADGRPAAKAIPRTTAAALAPGQLVSADGRALRLARPGGDVVRMRPVPAGKQVVGRRVRAPLAERRSRRPRNSRDPGRRHRPHGEAARASRLRRPGCVQRRRQPGGDRRRRRAGHGAGVGHAHGASARDDACVIPQVGRDQPGRPVLRSGRTQRRGALVGRPWRAPRAARPRRPRHLQPRRPPRGGGRRERRRRRLAVEQRSSRRCSARFRQPPCRRPRQLQHTVRSRCRVQSGRAAARARGVGRDRAGLGARDPQAGRGGGDGVGEHAGVCAERWPARRDDLGRARRRCARTCERRAQDGVPPEQLRRAVRPRPQLGRQTRTRSRRRRRRRLGRRRQATPAAADARPSCRSR